VTPQTNPKPNPINTPIFRDLYMNCEGPLSVIFRPGTNIHHRRYFCPNLYPNLTPTLTLLFSYNRNLWMENSPEQIQLSMWMENIICANVLICS